MTSAIWRLLGAVLGIFYRVERIGSGIPDGPVLLVANHANGLLDPVIVASALQRPPRFLAKSTLFPMPVVGWFVRALGSIPVYRRQDQGADTARNDEMFAAVRQALAEGGAICLFPEGISHSLGRLAPLRTGAARIALAAAAEGTPVQVVPIGLNFAAKQTFRSTAIVAFGPPISPAAWLPGYAAEPAEAVRGFTDQIAVHLRDVLIEADPVTEAELVARVDRVYTAARGLARSPAATLLRRRAIAEGIGSLRARDPERFAELYEQLRRYEQQRARFGLREDALLQRVPTGAVLRFALREGTFALALLPLAALGVLGHVVPFHAVRLLTQRVRVSLDQAATFKIAASLVIYGAWIAALAGVAWQWGGSRAGLAAGLVLLLLAPAALFAVERLMAVWEIAAGWLASQRTHDQIERGLVCDRAALADLLDETYRRVRAAEGAGAAGDQRSPRP
jgi:1-acyl-sn-glycerol-3-phosphate acyltransferase